MLPQPFRHPDHPHRGTARALVLGLVFLCLACTAFCASSQRAQVTYHDKNMDFSQIQRVVVLPFVNLTATTPAADRVRDVFMTMLQATGSVYVVPPGEIGRALARARVANPMQPTAEEAVALAKELKADAVISGTVREYGEVRSGNTPANICSVSLQLFEGETGKVVWSASSTKGGVTAGDRLLGGRGQPMNEVTEQAVRDLIDKLYR